MWDQVAERLRRQPGPSLFSHDQHHALLGALLPLLRAADRPRRRLLMPASSRDWMQQEAEDSIRAIQASGHPVYGDLADLHPRAECFGRGESGVESVSVDEMLPVTLDAFAAALAGPEG